MKLQYIIHALVLVVLIGCNKSEEIELQNNRKQLNLPVFTATFDNENSRTYVDDNLYMRWTADDSLSIFTATTFNQKYVFDGETGDNSGTFSAVNTGQFGTGNTISTNYAVYPYSKSTKISEDGTITLTLPEKQSYAQNSFGVNANTMVAATKNANDYLLLFKNVGGYLKLKLYGDNVTVGSIALSGNNGEKIAGTATVSVRSDELPSVTMGDGATTTITLDCGNGVKLGTSADTATEFWFVVPPTTFENGISVTVYDIDGKPCFFASSTSLTIARNSVDTMAAIEVKCDIPNNQIWYSSVDGKVVEPYKSDRFGANITSNVYKNGKGVITFDGEVTEINAEAFFNCTSMTNIKVPNSVTEIGHHAFEECKLLKNFIIPDGIKWIGVETFYGCMSLASITIPNSVISIENNAFHGCRSLTNITIPEGLKNIMSHAFQYCSSLTSINIPNGVTSIGWGAFDGCSSLTSVDIPDGVVSIEEWTFAHCSKLSNINIPNGVTHIGYRAFLECKSLKSVTIPSSVTSIGDEVFSRCSSLSGMYSDYSSADNRCLIVDGVLKAFAPAGLTEYTIPHEVTSIGDTAFQGCSSLASITIHSGVTSIGEYAFNSCIALTSITIPNSVTSIGDRALSACYNLKYLYCESTSVPSLGKESIEVHNLKAIYVPSTSTDAYKAAEGWKDYADKIVGISTEISKDNWSFLRDELIYGSFWDSSKSVPVEACNDMYTIDSMKNAKERFYDASIYKFWDGVIETAENNGQINYFHSGPVHYPFSYFIDMGRGIKIDQLRVWQRFDYLWSKYSPKTFEIWISNDSNAADGILEDWELVGQYTIEKPAIEAEAEQEAINGSHFWIYPEIKKLTREFRYLRFKCITDFSGEGYIGCLSELSLYGVSVVK